MWKLVLAFLLAALPVLAEPQRVDLGPRHYLIDLSQKPTGAMILALHGAAGSPGRFAQVTGITAPANAQGYAVIYPAGTGAGQRLFWNAGYCCDRARATGSDDMAFLDAVVADAARRFGLDAGKLYLTGMSNGSMMAETYAMRRAGRVKAVAGVAGPFDFRAVPAAAVPLLHIHGTGDRLVPYDGGPGRSDRIDFPGVPALIEAMNSVEPGLTATSRTIDTASGGLAAREDDYADAAGVTRLRLITIAGGGHVWPGGAGPQGRLGSGGISATEEVLRFFAEHP